MRSNFSLLAFLGFLSSTVDAHTWLENIMLIGSNGSFVGNPGYPRGYGPRTANVDPDPQNVNLIPPNGRPSGNAILATDLMCKATQTIGTYTPGYGPLTAAPGDQIALRYLENGHVTKDVGQTRPAHNGTVFVYGTNSPANTDTYLGIHRVWNTEGTGGDKRGKLIATRTFDDGRCFQVNGQPLSLARVAATQWTSQSDLECQTDIQIPTEAGTSGNYTMYWVWEWPQLNPTTGAVVSNESYTACLDIMMTAKSAASASGKVAISANQEMTGPNLGNIAIPNQLGSQFLVNPTALPQVTAGPAFSMSAAPAAATSSGEAPAALSSSTVVTSSATASLAAQNGFVTVTVTESVHETATVTVTQDATQQPALASATQQSSSSVYTAPTGIPSPQPFLDGKEAVVSARATRMRRRGARW